MAKGSSGTILLLGAVGVGVYGYLNGWFNSLLASFGVGMNPAPAPAPSAGNTPTPVPPLGTVVHSASDALRQVAAGDAYILPDAATFGQFSGALPGGYNVILTTDYGSILLRPDVYSFVQTSLTNRINRATSQGASAASLQQMGNLTLGQIQQMMSLAGLSGLGDYQRYVFSRTGYGRR